MYTTGDIANMRLPMIDFWNLLRGQMPPNCTLTIPTTGETYEDSTGELIELWTQGTTWTQPGQGVANYAAGVGARIVWQTNGLTNNRRVRGSSFVVPCSTGMYGPDGTIADAIVAAWNTGASAFVAATQSDFTIWTRPKLGVGGKSSGVTGHLVPDKISTLRSRRV